MCFHVCLLKPGISGYSAGTNCRESARALFNIIVWIDVNWLRYRAVQHRFFCYWRKRYSSRALLISRNGNRHGVWQPGLYMECQTPQIDTQPVLQVSHRTIYNYVCTGHYGEKVAQWYFYYFCTLYMQICQHTDHKVRFHALRETITDHSMGSYPR